MVKLSVTTILITLSAYFIGSVIFLVYQEVIRKNDEQTDCTNSNSDGVVQYDKNGTAIIARPVIAHMSNMTRDYNIRSGV